MRLTRDWESHTIHVSQERMIGELLDSFGMSAAKPRKVPMDPSCKLTRTLPGKELDTQRYPYSMLVGKLLYLATSTRPDIAYDVGVLARHMSNPSMHHWLAAKGVLRYLAGTRSHGLSFSGTAVGLQGWSDADFAGDVSTRRSTTGHAFICNSGAISWQSKVQPTVASSTLEAEYMAAAAATKEALALKQLFKELKQPVNTVSICADSQGALQLMDNPITSQRTKHIDVLHHFVRERVLMGQVQFAHVGSDVMVADILTKPLPMAKFVQHVAAMGVTKSLEKYG